MEQVIFKSIKVLKSGVQIKLNDLNDTDGNKLSIPDISTSAIASPAMVKALDKWVPEIKRRAKLTVDPKIKGLTIGHKIGFIQINVHYEYESDGFVSPQNCVSPNITQSAIALDEMPKEEQGKYLSDEMVNWIYELCEATTDYLESIKLESGQLSLFQLNDGK